MGGIGSGGIAGTALAGVPVARAPARYRYAFTLDRWFTPIAVLPGPEDRQAGAGRGSHRLAAQPAARGDRPGIEHDRTVRGPRRTAEVMTGLTKSLAWLEAISTRDAQ
jgi:hypothetical protein